MRSALLMLVLGVLVDAGAGSALKREMGNRLDGWLSKEDNLENGFPRKAIS